jgi:hypothetical protein
MAALFREARRIDVVARPEAFRKGLRAAGHGFSNLGLTSSRSQNNLC